MVYRGWVRNGVVVLDGPVPEEGTPVEVTPVDKNVDPRPGTGAALELFFRAREPWDAERAEEWDRLLAGLNEEKRVAAQAVNELYARRRDARPQGGAVDAANEGRSR